MSLHIGNLSPHIHIGDLEHVFQRFGRCSIRVKDKYGFVVYDYPASAEKALKTLRGTRICGEDLTLSWSKHQPHAIQRFGAGRMPFKQPYRKFPAKENAGQRFGQHDYEMDFKKANEGRSIGSSELIDDPISYHPDELEGYTGERDHSYLNNHHGFRDAERNHMEDDRWREHIVDPSKESYLENDIEFDRYEPGQSVGMHELDEHQPTSPLTGSPGSRKSKERTGNFYHTNSQKNCFLCGEVGHKMRNCPLERKRQVHRSHGRMVPGGRIVSSRYREHDGEPSGFRHRQRLLGHEDSRKKELRNKKRNRRDYESTDKDHLEKPRGPSSPSSRGYSSSREQSLSKPSKKSASLKSSPSRQSGSKTFKSPSVSLSMSSASLPLDLNRHPSPSQNKVGPESKDFVVNAGDLSHGTSSKSIAYTVENERDSMKDLSEKSSDPYNTVSKDSQETFVGKSLPCSVSNVANSENEKLVGEHSLSSESDIPAKPNASNLERISSEEISMVLKHYGLQCPEENEKDIPAESYFGSARLWPWEIVYYRRLKKGSISAANYSRRIAQNEKFGIVDKYVRCSSGWGQLKEKDR